MFGIYFEQDEIPLLILKGLKQVFDSSSNWTTLLVVKVLY